LVEGPSRVGSIPTRVTREKPKSADTEGEGPPKRSHMVENSKNLGNFGYRNLGRGMEASLRGDLNQKKAKGKKEQKKPIKRLYTFFKRDSEGKSKSGASRSLSEARTRAKGKKGGAFKEKNPGNQSQ